MRLLNAVIPIVFVLLLGCSTQQTKLEFAFEEMKKVLQEDSSFYNRVLTTPLDSLDRITPFFIATYKHYSAKGKIDSTIWFEIIENKADSLGVATKERIFVRSFQLYINTEKLDLERAKKEVLLAAKNKETRSQEFELQLKNKLRSVAKINDENCEIGDTVKITLLLEGNKDYYTIYSSTYHPSDSLKMTAVLISKFHDKEMAGHVSDSLKDNDPLNLFFKVKILQLSNASSHIFGQDALKRGDTFQLTIGSYNRLLK